jgi:hypothetical protein
MLHIIHMLSDASPALPHNLLQHNWIHHTSAPPFNNQLNHLVNYSLPEKCL